MERIRRTVFRAAPGNPGTFGDVGSVTDFVTGSNRYSFVFLGTGRAPPISPPRITPAPPACSDAKPRADFGFIIAVIAPDATPDPAAPTAAFFNRRTARFRGGIGFSDADTR